MKQRLKKTLTRGFLLFRDPYYQGFAAELAFFIILSIVPMLMLLSRLLGLFDLSLENLEIVLGQYMSDDLLSFALSLLSVNSSVTSDILFTVIALWAASRAQFSLIRMGNYTMSGGTSGYGIIGGYIIARLRAMLSIIVILIAFTAGLIILVYGKIIFNLVMAALTNLFNINITVSTLWLAIRWPIAFAIYFVVIWINYSLMSLRRIPLKDVVPGAVFASVGIILVTFFYALYINLIANYNIIYGALAAIVALMFWVYFISWCLGLGLICNRAWSDATEDLHRKKD